MPIRPSQVDRIDLVGLKEQVRQELPKLVKPEDDLLDTKKRRGKIRQDIQAVLKSQARLLSTEDLERLIQDLTNDVLGAGPLQSFLEDSDITEIMVNGPWAVFVKRRSMGMVPTSVVFDSEAHLRLVIERICHRTRQVVDEMHPLLDTALPDGSRLNVALPPISLSGPVLTIRKFPGAPLTREDLLATSTWNRAIADFLWAAVRTRLNIVVAGGTDAGKTTTLGVLGSAIQPQHRVVTIEETPELRFPTLQNLVSLQTRRATSEIAADTKLTIRDLVRNALRMRPDRLIVGEVRGAEALDMLQAMNTGHAGSLSTLHANSARDALWRLETMVLMAGMELPLAAVRRQVASAIDLVVYQEQMEGDIRRIREVAEVQGMDAAGAELSVSVIFRYEESREPTTGRWEGHFVYEGRPPRCLERLARVEEELVRSGIRLPWEILRSQERHVFEDGPETGESRAGAGEGSFRLLESALGGTG